MGEQDPPGQEDLEPRPPTQIDLVHLCRELNRHGAKYLVIGGFAVIHARYPTFTGDIDLLMETTAGNEKRCSQR